MADYTPVYGKGSRLTFKAGAAITGGDVLVFSGVDEVSPCAAGPANYAGVAAHDAAMGDLVTVYCGSGLVHETTITAGQAAGTLLYAGASGRITQTAGAGYGAVAIGVAVRTATGGPVTQRWKALVG